MQNRGPPRRPGQLYLNPRVGGSSASMANSSTNLLSPSSSTGNLLSPVSPSRSPSGPIPGSISDKFMLGADPRQWGSDISPDHAEPDDFLHNPDPRRDRKNDQSGTFFTRRGCANLGCLVILVVGLMGLFAGYPITMYFTTPKPKTLGAYNIGGINASGQVPTMTGSFSLIDPETPQDALTKPSFADGTEWELVFSDEFNTPNRSFYPGDDPYWEAVDLHYWATNNLEWYDPRAITTENGHLSITLSNFSNHGLYYQGGMMASWNKFCFTGGLVEVSVSLPGVPTVWGLWPAVWTMGNLGRAGYGATLDGTWPYSYDACDVGTLPNQTQNGQPVAATTDGPQKDYFGALSYLPGQRFSACTCPGEEHPGPVRADGSFAGRSAPEIDILEAQVDSGTRTGWVSQSGQWAPFNDFYQFNNASSNYYIKNTTETKPNGYKGGVYQQATSSVSMTDQKCYTQGEQCFSTYGLEYIPGNDGYIKWICDGKDVWGVNAGAMGPDPVTLISQRPVPQEPMYLLMNLGISKNFGGIDFPELVFPTSLWVDYIRVYQPAGSRNIGCDPPDFPTEQYILNNMGAYTNPNLTTYAEYGKTFPKNNLTSPLC